MDTPVSYVMVTNVSFQDKKISKEMKLSSKTNSGIVDYLRTLGSNLDLSSDSLAIILAAGHGKRIKSETTKMLHEVWGVPTVVRVSNSAKKGLDSDNQIIVVGIKAKEVAESVGTNNHRVFVFQAEQSGTGDAVKTALEAIPKGKFKGNIYIFPGDMGLLTPKAVEKFKRDFLLNTCDMMVLTGIYEGNPENNYYGRILRVPAKDISGRSSGEDLGKVIEIKEHKDIMALKANQIYQVDYQGRTYGFSKEELLNMREFNTGIYAFKADRLLTYIHHLKPDNVQREFYVTDLIRIFNQNALTVKASVASDNRTVLGFNVKSVLKEMENIARERVYEKLKDIIAIQDKDDFFIADEVVEQIRNLDKKLAPLDIFVGKGVYIGKDVQLNKGVKIKNYAYLSGRIILGERVRIQENVHLSTYPHQTMEIGRNTEIFQGDIIKGRIQIGENCQIESSVNITGSDEFPTGIGNNVIIKGTSYVFGSIIEDDVWIEHSVLKCKYVERTVKKDGTVQPVRYVLPLPEGLDSIKEIPNNGTETELRDIYGIRKVN
jgi:bifunctional UDP-N-acetylglucosamine pyrophosphorylase/glucosamine-1-phosphate N-acetyltransferase